MTKHFEKQKKVDFLKILFLFLFIILISIPSLLSIPIKGRESGGIVVDTSEQHKEVTCLEEALAYEAFGESITGIEAVLSVIVNRKNKYKQSFCEIIRKPKQFSFRNGHAKNKNLLMENFYKNKKYWVIKKLAYEAYTGEFQPTLPPDTLYFIVKGKSVHWNKGKTPVLTIGGHSFYN